MITNMHIQINLQVLKQILSKRKELNLIKMRQRMANKNKFKYKSLTNIMSLAKQINDRCKDSPPQRQAWFWGEYKFFLWATIHYSQTSALNMNTLQTIKGFKAILDLFPYKEKTFLMYQYILAFSDKGGFIASWTSEEIQIFQQFSDKSISNLWKEISYEMYKVSGGKYFKDPQECRNRWTNHSNPKINKSQWTVAQDIQLINHIMNTGKRWSKIAKQINNGRTEHMLKNRYRYFFRKLNIKQQGNISYACQQILSKLVGIKIEANQERQEHITNTNESQIRRQNMVIKADENGLVKKEELEQICYLTIVPFNPIKQEQLE